MTPARTATSAPPVTRPTWAPLATPARPRGRRVQRAPPGATSARSCSRSSRRCRRSSSSSRSSCRAWVAARAPLAPALRAPVAPPPWAMVRRLAPAVPPPWAMVRRLATAPTPGPWATAPRAAAAATRPTLGPWATARRAAAGTKPLAILERLDGRLLPLVEAPAVRFCGSPFPCQREQTLRLGAPRDLKGGPDTRSPTQTEVPDFPRPPLSRSGGTRRADVRQ